MEGTFDNAADVIADALRQIDPDGQESLRRRAYIGHRCIALAHDGPWTAQEEVEGAEDRETYATDAISDILTALYGPAGVHRQTADGDGWVPEYNDERCDEARRLVERAVESWIGDAEDYSIELDEEPDEEFGARWRSTAIDAIDARLDWLDDYGAREYKDDELAKHRKELREARDELASRLGGGA